MNNNVPEDKNIEPQETLPKYKEYSTISNEFSEFAHGYIHDNIGRADQKATILFSFLSFTYLYVFDPSHELIKILKLNFHFGHIFIYIMIISLAFSIIFAFLTIFPRLRGGQHSHDNSTVLPRLKGGEFSYNSSNLLYWESIIIKNDNSVEYANKVKKKTPDELVKIKLQHCYEISLICKEKYKSLKLSMIAAISGILLFLSVQSLIVFFPGSLGIDAKSQQRKLELPTQIYCNDTKCTFDDTLTNKPPAQRN